MLKSHKQHQSDFPGKSVYTNHHIKPCIHYGFISKLTLTLTNPKLTLFKNLFDQQIVSEIGPNQSCIQL